MAHPMKDHVEKYDFSAAISPIEEIVEEARNGKMYILVDAEDRENEGDLIIPAQFATPAAVNFMARFGRGLICLCLTRDRARTLQLDMMARENRESMKTAFTVSIEAKEGVTTGISAHDRAHTIAVGVDPTKGADDIVSPGHIFPLVAREGGVLVRAGHTEASVDISRLAGLYPAAVICEIMNDDGTMARLPELVTFAQLHGLKIGTIADLIAWRRRHDRFLERRIESDFESAYGGKFRIIVFRNTLDGAEHVALVKGRIQGDIQTLVRVHRMDFCPTSSAKRASAKAWSAAPWRNSQPPKSPVSWCSCAWVWAKRSPVRLAGRLPPMANRLTRSANTALARRSSRILASGA